MNSDSELSRSSFGAGKRLLPGKAAACLAVATLALACASAQAQVQATPPPTATPPEVADEDVEELTSEEQGKVSLGESFEPVTRRERIRQQRAKAFKDTKWDAQLRTYLLDRDKFDGSESSSMALGGYIGFKTGWFRDKFSLGATAYTSQRLYGPEDKDGAGLLQTGQDGYAVLGEAYLEYRFTDSVFFDIGRKGFNSPYINKNDTRMTPNTFELAMVQGVVGDPAADGQWRFGVGYVDEIKTKTSENLRFHVGRRRRPGQPRQRRVRGRCQLRQGPVLARFGGLPQRRRHQHLLHRGQIRRPAGGEQETQVRRAILQPEQRWRRLADRYRLRHLAMGRQGRTGGGQRAVHRRLERYRRWCRPAFAVGRHPQLQLRAGAGLQPCRRRLPDVARRLRLQVGAGVEHVRALGQRHAAGQSAAVGAGRIRSQPAMGGEGGDIQGPCRCDCAMPW